MRKRLAAGVCLLGLQGCATTFRPIESVAADVRRDEVAAAVAMRDDEIGLEGQVKSKGLKTEKTAKAKVTVFAAAIGKAEIAEEEANIGYIELGSTSSQPGGALCLFENFALDGLATVQEGQTVRLHCRFSKVEGERPNRFPVFRDCWVDD
jgi:hypothetical protein